MTESKKKDIAENYIKALTNRDAALLTSIATEDIVWSLPATSRIMSGEARGNLRGTAAVLWHSARS